MKIDIYNNHEVYKAEKSQDRIIAAWCKTRGLSLNFVLKHPHLNDVVFLIDFFQEFQQELISNKRLKGVFDAYWGISYSNKKALQSRAFQKFEQVATECLAIRHERQAAIDKIKSLRQTTGTSQTQSVDHNYQANGSYSPQSHIRPGNHEGSAAEG
jgi:hypothetical protein